ncbi:MAG: tetratricopeptide repeat protein, partial [Myxococcales bacterium]|nr:tetratricopeptide repeat protein [Myxococcales bacterium]
MTRRAITVCLLLAASVPRADAQPAAPEDATQEEARSLFHAGRAAFDVGRYDAALRYFEQSYELSGRPVLLFNLGAAHDRLQHNERALERYRAYLAAMPDAPNRELVERRIAFLTARLVETPTDQSGTSSSSDPSSASNTRDADAPPSSA